MQKQSSAAAAKSNEKEHFDKIEFLKNVHPCPGKPYPLGARYDGRGTNFALFSESAEAVDLCLFLIEDPGDEVIRISVTERTDQIFHCYLPELPPGILYGFRVYGPWDPQNGHLFNPSKLLMDPYGKGVNTTVDWSNALYAYPVESGNEKRYLQEQHEDSAPFVNKSVIIDCQGYDWQGDLLPETPMHKSVIYELHVKGMTALNPLVPEADRGTYKGLAHPKVLAYLKDLGITAIELMPVHQFVHSETLLDRGLRNYWGYNTLNYFSPHSEYASNRDVGAQVNEFKDLVRAYHAEGIEVILDVVFNHTSEGNHYGPMLSYKGIDNRAYYRLVEDQPEYYMDYTGTGNTLNMVHPRTLQLVMDSLRYWVTEMHVDGFRFDLAAALARGLYDVGKLSTFLDTIQQDPVISQVKLIAEPWDVGPGGYQVGNFPILWSEWNGEYRDCMRKFWKGDEGQLPDLAYRLTGSSDLYQKNGRNPWNSINFVTAHDGFTLRDLVSYNKKHNEANGEDNEDGTSNTNSWNCGTEGHTDNKDINALRAKQQRNFLATLLLSQGVPMINMGDEYGRTQHGNNNVYCQDNELSYVDWAWNHEQQELHNFTRALLKLRADNPVLHRGRFFSGRQTEDSALSDIYWLKASGKEMAPEDWGLSSSKSLGVILNGEAMDERDENGEPIRDDIFMLLLNAHFETVKFTMPGSQERTEWRDIVNTADGTVASDRKHSAQSVFDLPPRSTVLFIREKSYDEVDDPQPWRVEMAQ